MLKIAFPSKFLPLSSSIILVRPKQNTSSIKSSFDYQILILKRNSKISFGSFYSFPGGIIEKQDYIEKWQTSNSTFYDTKAIKYQDFTKRICAIRETFEECNILLAEQNQSNSQQPKLEDYNTTYKGNFPKFCNKLELKPKISQLYGFQRIASPLGIYPANNTQFYLYFCDQEPVENIMKLNYDEFTEYKWLSPEEILKMYEQNNLSLFPPQVLLVCSLYFMNNSYNELKEIAKQINTNILTYLSNKNHFMDLSTLQDEQEISKQMKKIFDKSDLLSDEERQDLLIYHNEVILGQYPDLQIIKQAKTLEQMTDLCKLMQIGLFYGDFYSTNDSYPYMMERTQRGRMWAHKKSGKILRIEISKKLFKERTTEIQPMISSKL